MRRLLLIAAPIIGLAIAAWFYFGRTSAGRQAVTELLPRDTVFFAHLPDLNRTRDEWHRSDIYQLCSEPAVRDFLRSSSGPTRKHSVSDEAATDIDRLEPKDVFVALIPTADAKTALVAGFRFNAKQSQAEEIIDKWRKRLLSTRPHATATNSTYRQHQLHAFSSPAVTVTTVSTAHWFFLATDVAAVHALLDRADQPPQDRQPAFASTGRYRAAVAHMPRDYTAALYLEPRPLAEKFAALRSAFGQQLSADNQALIQQTQSVCATTRFEGGKIHDVVFVGVPRQAGQNLTRSSQALGSADTVLYFATLLNQRSLGTIKHAAALAPIGTWFQKFARVAAANGITADDWQAAFTLELGTLADWPEKGRSPALIATLPVKDHARALKIASAIATASNEDAAWVKTEKDGVTYLSMPPSASLFAITPTIALSDRLLIAGLDAASVEAAIGRSRNAGGGLQAARGYQAAARLVPLPTASFGYIDTALLYARVDASLRPLLVMSAAFMPAISRYLEPAKLPPPEAVAKHLSPIVSSQRYVEDGYIAESVGPISANDAAVAIALAAIYWTVFGHHAAQ